MGVDYFHGVYAADLTNTNGLEMAEALAVVLRDYGLVDEPTHRWCLDADGVRHLDPDESPRSVRNVGLRFSSMTGHHEPIVRYLLAKAELKPGDDWAWADISIVAGEDFRVANGGEADPFRVTQSATIGGEDSPSFSPQPMPSDGRTAGWDRLAFSATTWDASTGCSAPVCSMEPSFDPRTGEEVERPDGFTGLWRAGVFFHSKPYDWHWSNELLHPVLPDTDFKSRLWATLGGAAYEFGYPW